MFSWLGSSRRAFLHRGVCCLAGLRGLLGMAAEPSAKPRVRVGLVTDLHYANKPEAKTRYYRETLGKMREAVGKFNDERPDVVVELGDFIDAASTVEEEIGWLKQIEKVFAEVRAPRHYVLGNHCVGTLTKAEFREHTGAAREAHYSFDQAGVHFVILDACFRADGEPYQRNNFHWTDANIPDSQVAWLRDDLAEAAGPVIVLAHQRLDESGKHMVLNAAAVRAELEKPARCWRSCKATRTRTTTSRSPASTTARWWRWWRDQASKAAATRCSTSCRMAHCACTAFAARARATS